MCSSARTASNGKEYKSFTRQFSTSASFAVFVDILPFSPCLVSRKHPYVCCQIFPVAFYFLDKTTVFPDHLITISSNVLWKANTLLFLCLQKFCLATLEIWKNGVIYEIFLLPILQNYSDNYLKSDEKRKKVGETYIFCLLPWCRVSRAKGYNLRFQIRWDRW